MARQRRWGLRGVLLAVVLFSIYVLWTWWSGRHTNLAHDPNSPWVSIGAAGGLILAAISIALEAARRPVLSALFASAVLALAGASFAALSWASMRPSVALSFSLTALGLLSLRVGRLRRAAVPAAFGASSLVIAVSVAAYFIVWRLLGKQGLYLLLASPLTAALQAVLSAAFLTTAVRSDDVRALARYPALVLSAGAVGLVLVGSWTFVIATSADHARREAEERVNNGVKVLTEHAHRTMDPATLLLQTIADRVQTMGVAPFGESRAEWQHVRSAAKTLKQVSAIVVLDARGRVVLFSEQFPPVLSGDFSHRDYFAAHRGGEDRFLGQLIVSGSGKKVFTLSRRLTDAQGGFAGVALASMELDYFARFYESVEGGADASIALIRSDGRPLVRVPLIPDLEKMDISKEPLFTEQLTARRHGTFLSTSPFDGRQRLASFRASEELPLVVVTTLGTDPIAAGVEQEFVASALLLSMALVVLSGGLGNQVRSRERERRVHQVLAQSQAFTRSVLDSMSASVAIIDPAGTILDVNAQWGAFARRNGSANDSFVGFNYLDVCDAAPLLGDAPDPAAAGIRAVLGRTTPAFHMTYACHSPDEQRWFRMLVTPLAGGENGAVISHEDVTELKLAELKLEKLARVDVLTGLPNRRDFEDRIEEAMARTRRSQRPMGLIYLDVDHFKAVNDTRGHAAGDEVLREFARRLSGAIRVTDRAFRLAGDEFVAVLEGLNAPEDAAIVAQSIVREVQRPMVVDGVEMRVTTSLGVANFLGGEGTSAELMERADRALYRAKAAGRNTFAETTL